MPPKNRDHENEEKQVYENGATASKLDERFDLIPFAGLEYAARRFALGAKKHGSRNWESGDRGFAEARLNHLLRHAAAFAETRQTEDLEAIICNGMMLAKFRAEGKI
jgi:hypothetical protein